MLEKIHEKTIKIGRVLRTVKRYIELNENGEFILRGEATVFEDLKFPANAEALNPAQTKVAYDYDDLGYTFASDADYDNINAAHHIAQLAHATRVGSPLHPHLHYEQTADNLPNFLIGYRIQPQGSATATAWVLSPITANVFPYVSGSLNQIATFPEIDLSVFTGVSGMLDFKLYRDTGNTSGEFAGADPLATAVLVKEFDAHYEIDTLGSFGQYTKELP